MVDYLNELRDACLEAYTGILQGLRGPDAKNFSGALLHYISEGSVSHISGVWPNSKHSQLVGSYNLYNAHQKQNMHVQKTTL